MNIEVTEHVCIRYIERFNPGLASINNVNNRMLKAKKAVLAIIDDARYVSDDVRGILLKSKSYNCYLIIRDRKLITIYPPRPKAKKNKCPGKY